MSFESDKSDSCFTKGVWCCLFNRAIGWFPAEKAEGTGGTMSFCWYFPADLMWAAVQNLCSTMKGIEKDSAAVCCKKARVDASVANPKERPYFFLQSPQVTRDVFCCAGAVQTIETSCDVVYITRCDKMWKCLMAERRGYKMFDISN